MLSKKQIKENIRINPTEIKHIENPSEDIQLASVSSDVHAIQYIKNPCESVMRYVLKRDPFLIRFMKKPPKKMMRYALFIKEEAVRYIHDSEIQKELLLKNDAAFCHIQNPTQEVQIFYVQRNFANISYIEEPSENIQRAAIESNIFSFHYIDNPSLQIQWHSLSLLQNGTFVIAPQFFPENTFCSFIANGNIQDALMLLPEHKTVLQNNLYFEHFIMFLLKNISKDIEKFITILQPLTMGQENIWKKYRLRTIL